MRPLVMVILDGWGEAPPSESNGIFLGDTSEWTDLVSRYPSVLLRTDGERVGLPEGQMGNSEVGHMTIGAGRVIWQDLPRISSVLSGGVRDEEMEVVWGEFCEGMRECGGGRVHMLGLMSKGGVHAHTDHWVGMTRKVREAGFEVVWHVMTDGRDTVRGEAPKVLREVWDEVGGDGVKVGTILGRFYGMDRDNRWDRTRKAYEAIVYGRGERWSADWQYEMDRANSEEGWGGLGGSEEMLEPKVVGDYGGVREGDGLLCINFRTDRVRQILSGLLKGMDEGEERGRFGVSCGMVRYSDDLGDGGMLSLFSRREGGVTLGEVVSRSGRRQLRVAETEKFAHVTYFLNGGRESSWEGESRVIVPSPRVESYDETPKMSAREVTDEVLLGLEGDAYDFFVVNFANPDMLGHTGNLLAVKEGVSYVDKMLGEIARKVEGKGGCLLVLSDHGNAEEMRDLKTGEVSTSHSLNRVRCICCCEGAELRVGEAGGYGLSDVAPSVLSLMGLEVPEEMTGEVLFCLRGRKV